MSSLLLHYDRCLRTNPLSTKMVTNLFICGTGDMICQGITKSWKSLKGEWYKDWDYLRTARFGAVGACVQTTLLHWYLTRIVPALRIGPEIILNKQKRRLANLSLRMMVHCSTLLPFRIGIIFFALSTLQHMSVRKGFEGL